MKTEMKQGIKVQCHRGDLRGQVGTVARIKSGTEMVVEFFINGQRRNVKVSKSNWSELNLRQCGERDDTREECEANIAYYNAELKAWKERLEKINKADNERKMI